MRAVGSAPRPPRPEPPPPIELGELLLERYRVVEEIAAGGHSVVFLGTDERLARPVCIKVFAGLGGASGVGRTTYEHFVQEAFALSRLTHPNTLRIYDFGHLGAADQGGMPLQVCEYMNGGTLASVVREHGPQTPRETVRVIGAMCAALAEAHALGIVHRDIKPANILFGTVGGIQLPKLADFGIAKWSADAEDSGQRAEDTQLVAGRKLAMYSPSWAAPEQLAGTPVSPATDIYSLAVVAVYMLSGRAVFADDDVYAGYKKRRHADELVRAALEPLGVPRTLIDVLSRALAFEAGHRLPSVEALAAGLVAALAPAPDEVAVPPALRPAPPPRAGYTTLPGARAPWITAEAAGTGPARPLELLEVAQLAGHRQVQFVPLGPNAQVDLAGVQQLRVRVTLINSPHGLVVHLRGLTCFVAHVGGRPSPAVQIVGPSDIALVTPRAEEIGHIRVVTGAPEPGQHVFSLGPERIAIRTDDCADPILFDFGPGSDAYFVYTRGRALPRSRRS